MLICFHVNNNEEERRERKRTYDKSVELAMFGDNILDDLGGHGSIPDVEQNGVTDPAQFLDLVLDSLQRLDLASCNDYGCSQCCQLMCNASSYAYYIELNCDVGYGSFFLLLRVVCEKLQQGLE